MDEVVVPVLQPTLQSMGLQSGEMRMSAVSVDVTRKPLAGSEWTGLSPPSLIVLMLMLMVCHNGIVRHSQEVASLCGGGGGCAAGVDCGTFVVGGLASACIP